MKFAISLLLFCPAALFAGELPAEPPLKLTVSVAGKTVDVTPGEAARLTGEFKDPEVKVTVAPVRTFRCRGLSFDYPASYNWEATDEDDLLTCTVEGPDVTIILMHTKEDVSAAGIAEEQRESYGKDAVRRPVSETFGGREFKGWKVDGAISATAITVRCYVLEGAEGRWMLHVIDTGTRKEGELSAELKSTFELFGRTLKTAAP